MSLLLLIISPLIHVTGNLRQFVTKPNEKIPGLAQNLLNNKLLQSCYLVFYLMVLMHYCSIDDNDTTQPKTIPWLQSTTKLQHDILDYLYFFLLKWSPHKERKNLLFIYWFIAGWNVCMYWYWYCVDHSSWRLAVSGSPA